MKVMERSLFNERGMANEHDAAAFQFGGNGNEVRMITTGGFLYSPPWGVLRIGVPWYNWYLSDGAKGEEPPEVIQRLYETIEKWKTTLPGNTGIRAVRQGDPEDPRRESLLHRDHWRSAESRHIQERAAQCAQ